MKKLRRILASAAIAAALSVGSAEAHLIDLGEFYTPNVLANPGAEADYIETFLGLGFDLTYLNKWNAPKEDGTGGGFEGGGAVDDDKFSVDPGGISNTQEIEWDLTGTGYAALYVLVKDGKTADGHYYRLYEVSDDQTVVGGPDLVTLDNPVKDISHIAWFGARASVPDGGLTLTMLGFALAGLGLVRLRFN
jgi:hypothetical protein